VKRAYLLNLAGSVRFKPLWPFQLCRIIENADKFRDRADRTEFKPLYAAATCLCGRIFLIEFLYRREYTLRIYDADSGIHDTSFFFRLCSPAKLPASNSASTTRFASWDFFNT